MQRGSRKASKAHHFFSPSCVCTCMPLPLLPATVAGHCCQPLLAAGCLCLAYTSLTTTAVRSVTRPNLKEQKSIKDDPSSSFRTIIVQWERSGHTVHYMSHIEKV